MLVYLSLARLRCGLLFSSATQCALCEMLLFSSSVILTTPQAWNKIPEGIDILMTHGPPRGQLDRCSTGEECGCQHLKFAVQNLKPVVHLFGHIHEGYVVCLCSDKATSRAYYDTDMGFQEIHIQHT